MSDPFVRDFLLPDSNTRRFHAGDACQWAPPIEGGGEVSEETAAMIAAHRESIHAPGARSRGRFGLDEDGNPIETSYLGVGVDPETGALVPLDAEGNPREAQAASARPARRRPEPPSSPSQPAPTTSTTDRPRRSSE